MALIVETGEGLPNADSYISLEEANAYFIGKRLHSSAWTAALDATKEVALKQAAIWLDGEFNWTGQIKVTEPEPQALGWPRVGAYDRSNRLRPDDVVPPEVKYAVCELAFFLLAEDRFVGSQGVGLKRLRVDVIELEYRDSGTAPQTFPPHVSRMLNGLGEPVRGRGLIKTVSLRRT